MQIKNLSFIIKYLFVGYTTFDIIRNDPSSRWFYYTGMQLRMEEVLVTRRLTVFVPNDPAFMALSENRRFRLRNYLNRLYYVFLQHVVIDKTITSGKLKDGMVLEAGIGSHLFINVRKNRKTGVSL